MPGKEKFDKKLLETRRKDFYETVKPALTEKIETKVTKIRKNIKIWTKDLKDKFNDAAKKAEIKPNKSSKVKSEKLISKVIENCGELIKKLNHYKTIKDAFTSAGELAKNLKEISNKKFKSGTHEILNYRKTKQLFAKLSKKIEKEILINIENTDKILEEVKKKNQEIIKKLEDASKSTSLKPQDWLKKYKDALNLKNGKTNHVPLRCEATLVRMDQSRNIRQDVTETWSDAMDFISKSDTSDDYNAYCAIHQIAGSLAFMFRFSNDKYFKIEGSSKLMKLLLGVCNETEKKMDELEKPEKRK